MIYLFPDKFIHALRSEFSAIYPFLNLEFYKIQDNDQNLLVRRHISHQGALKIAGLKTTGKIELNDNMTVAELEKQFHDEFDLNVQVARQSGTIWLETTMTDGWTLRQQNEHGREITKGRDYKEDQPGEFDLTRGNGD